jgi:two-component system, chemotaxis family, sensor kinase CheA
VDRIAQETGKPAQLSASIATLTALPARTHESLQKIALQLVRNAVVHGVEDVTTRVARNKPATAAIDVRLHRDQDNTVELAVQDDGGGLDLDRIRQRLIDLGWMTPAQVAELGDAQLASQIFRPGFSTAQGAGEHAGRGVGLDIVSAEVRRLGARLLVSSRPEQGMAFRVRLEAV